MNDKEQPQTLNLADYNLARLAHNHLMKEKGGEYQVQDINILNSYLGNLLNPDWRALPKYKVGVMMMCVNQPYWQYLSQIVTDMKNFFLPGHTVEYHVWSDVFNHDFSKDNKELTFDGMYPIEPIEWPHGTLMRYHTFLQQEEVLEKYDYLFYIDVDMRMVGVVGDEIIGEGLTMAEHPMYALRKEYVPPYEPNQESEAYIKRFGMVLNENGKPRFKPLYAAGGFQGGKAKDFIEAMKKMRSMIDKDFTNNYIAIWNDESHWNKYLADHYPGKIIALGPEYIYPDSLINEYYVKVWGKNVTPRIITLTKPFSTTKEGGDDLRQKLATM